jgi:hypothetical protein
MPAPIPFCGELNALVGAAPKMLLLMAPIAVFEDPLELEFEEVAAPGNPPGAFIWGLEVFGGAVVNGWPVFGSVWPGVVRVTG